MQHGIQTLNLKYIRKRRTNSDENDKLDKIQHGEREPLTSTCLRQCVRDDSISSIYTGCPGVETLPTAPTASKPDLQIGLP